MSAQPETTASERNASFGAWLRRARNAAGLTQEGLAERAGLSSNAVSDLERGEHRYPYPATVRALATALGLTDEQRSALISSIPRRGQAPAPDDSTDHRRELPVPLSPLIGREDELAAVSALLRQDGVRLVTLTGPGGVGKTRLALQIVAEVGADVSDGVAFVPLASVQDPALVASTIAHALGIVEAGSESPVSRLADAIRDRRLLLILDNLEHLLDAATLVSELLIRCRRLVVLATSRVILRLDGEHVFPVPPLAVPDPKHQFIGEQLEGIAAVRLFVARARAADPAFALSDGNAGAVSAICHRLDGLPLAIELAAARTPLLSPDMMLPRLARRLPLLTGGRRDAPARHATMSDAIAWSHDLLSPDEQLLFRRLAVFVGGCTLEAADAVGRADDACSFDVLAVLSALVDHSLLRRVPDTDGGPVQSPPRFEMLETIREFGLNRLAASGEEATVRAAHTTWFLDLVALAAPAWFSPAQQQWGERLESDHDNLRSVLARAAETADAVALIKLIAAVWPFWFIRGHWAEGHGWLNRALDCSTGTRTIERAWCLIGATALGLHRSGGTWANDCGEEALGIAREIGDTFVSAHALISLSVTAASLGAAERSRRLTEEALELLHDLSDTVASATPTASVLLTNLAVVALDQSDRTQARSLAETALNLQHKVRFAWGAADSLMVLARIARTEGNATEAVTLARESLELAWDQRGLQQIGVALDLLAILAVETDTTEQATRLFGAADGVRERLGITLEPARHPDVIHGIAMCRERLSEETFAASWAAGLILPLEESVDVALSFAAKMATQGAAFNVT
jgi:predicted ATPase/DNA-binding XRE family transcriptional regulator